MDELSRKILEIFVEDAVRYIAENNYGGLASIYRKGEGEKWQTNAAIQGFLATFGKFIKSRDKIALYVLQRDAAGQPAPSQLLKLTGMPESWYELVRQTYKLFDDLLAIAPPNLVYNGESITRWTVLETFLYGKFLHVNLIHRETLKKWERDPDLFGNLLLDFITTVAFMFFEMLPVVEASKHELERASGPLGK